MTELVDYIKKRKEEMYDGIAKQWHDWADRAYEGQSDALKEQMRVHKRKHEDRRAREAEKDEEAKWDKLTNINMRGGSITYCKTPKELADHVDVTAWGDAERNRIPGTADWDAVYDKQWRPMRAVKIHQREADNAHLRKVFDEALRLGAVIVWYESLPSLSALVPKVQLTPELQPLGNLYRRMLSVWGTTPPYIEVVDRIKNGCAYTDWVYSIKPVWEEP